MNEISISMAEYKLIWEDKEKKPWYLTMERYKVIMEAINGKKLNDFILDSISGETFKKKEIKSVEKITKEERARFVRKYIPHKDNYEEEWREKFYRKFEEWKLKTPDEKKVFANKYKYRNYQYEYMITFPESTLREQNAALAEFIIEQSGKSAPKWIYKFANR